VVAGSGGNGCVSFLREKYIEEGPANGGDGGSGGSIYIQAVEGLSSLHKLARRGVIRAGRGKNGQGKSKGGKRGHDVLIQVPVGTVVREVGRYDPVEEEEQNLKTLKAEMEQGEALQVATYQRDRWVLYPGSQPSDFLTMPFPTLPPPRRSQLAAMEPKAPIHLDLSKHMDQPMLLAAGAVGGFGNPHFVSRSIGRPRFATKGEGGMTLHLEFELKLLADVGLVGLPNAGKSTLLRSLTNSRTRIGNWEFTTLSPSIGTVVIDDFKGRPLVELSNKKAPRTNFTIADIPGLVEDAHLDRGLGLGFLRHIERARILGFVVDLSGENPVQTLRQLWYELGEYDRMRDEKPDNEAQSEVVSWSPFGSGPTAVHIAGDNESESPMTDSSPGINYSKSPLPPLTLPPIYTKPWFVIATKADLPNTQENFRALQQYLLDVQNGVIEHPSGHKDGYRERLCVVPVSAVRAQGVDKIPSLVMSFLEGS
jgi:GTP-binding protein